MIVDFLQAKRLFDAFAAWQSAEKYPSLAAEAAPALVAAARDVGSFFTAEPIRAICQPIDSLNAMILDAEIDDDETLAEDLRRDKERVTVHVARRLAQCFEGKTTNLARTMKASLVMGERAKRDESFPSDHGVGQGTVVPLQKERA